MCYTSLSQKQEGVGVAVKYSHKLDALQEMAKEHVEEPHKAYLIGLLAEHAEEAEVDDALLEWVRGVL